MFFLKGLCHLLLDTPRIIAVLVLDRQPHPSEVKAVA